MSQCFGWKSSVMNCNYSRPTSCNNAICLYAASIRFDLQSMQIDWSRQVALWISGFTTTTVAHHQNNSIAIGSGRAAPLQALVQLSPWPNRLRSSTPCELWAALVFLKKLSHHPLVFLYLYSLSFIVVLSLRLGAKEGIGSFFATSSVKGDWPFSGPCGWQSDEGIGIEEFTKPRLGDENDFHPNKEWSSGGQTFDFGGTPTPWYKIKTSCLLVLQVDHTSNNDCPFTSSAWSIRFFCLPTASA